MKVILLPLAVFLFIAFEAYTTSNWLALVAILLFAYSELDATDWKLRYINLIKAAMKAAQEQNKVKETE